MPPDGCRGERRRLSSRVARRSENAVGRLDQSLEQFLLLRGDMLKLQDLSAEADWVIEILLVLLKPVQFRICLPLQLRYHCQQHLLFRKAV